MSREIWYQYLQNINKINQFNQCHYESEFIWTKSSTPVIKTEEIDFYNSKLNYTPGYLTAEKIFYPCPISVMYVLIKSLSFHSSNTSEFTIVVYSKNFEEKKVLTINNNHSYDVLSDIIHIVNILNLYIDHENELKDLDENILQKKNSIDYLTEDNIIALIEKLNFNFFIDGQRRIGKDDTEWNELEIGNLPKSFYIRNLFFKILEKKHVGTFTIASEKVTLKSSLIHIEYDYNHTPYTIVGYNGRKKIEPDTSVTNHIKDILKFNICQLFDEKIEICERIKIEK
ncbi:hypothetical protein [Mariniflexile sp.]|uniref:hypothetical protein n=1 Tax=Mariniflexile sp. TaxID=1979402 RepID=UPI004047708D